MGRMAFSTTMSASRRCRGSVGGRLSPRPAIFVATRLKGHYHAKLSSCCWEMPRSSFVLSCCFDRALGYPTLRAVSWIL